MSLAQFAFARPGWLLALLPLALLLWRAWRARPADQAWRDIVDPHLLPHVIVGTDTHGRRRGFALLAAGGVLAVLALAGPLFGERPAASYRRDATRVLVVELSPQMAAATPALDRLRFKILGLLRTLPEAETALIVYAGEPYLVAPPTTDVDTLARFVPELAADVVPVAGNRPERALAMAGRLLARSGAQARELLWITAGAGDAAPAATGDARVFVLHVAAAASPDLAAFAARSGGSYVRMTADDGDLRALAAALAQGKSWRPWQGHDARAALDLGPWLLLALLPLAALCFRRGLLTLLAAPLAAAGLLAPAPAEAFVEVPAALADSFAWRRLQAGDAGGAAADFRDPRWRAAALYRAGRFDAAAGQLAGRADADSVYNRGNALARQGQLAEALAAYESALTLRPDDADVRHNRDLVRRLLDQQQDSARGGSAPPPPREQKTPAAAEREAARLAEQWLRRVPDESASLLRRKLLLEHRRRLAGEAPPPW